MDEHRLVRIAQDQGIEKMLVNSAADWGRSDPLKVPKTARAMLDAGFSEADVEKLVWDNPLAFFGQSGRIELDEDAAAPDVSATFAGNSILRGARPGS